MLFDTHTHIQFKVFDEVRGEVIERSMQAGVEKIIAVGTDLGSSKKAVEIAQKYVQVFACVGIHPHHLFEDKDYSEDLESLEKLIKNEKVLAIGETGLDRYSYKKTKYSGYEVSKEFLERQKVFFKAQIKLAKKYQKRLIMHNIGAVDELLEILEENWDEGLKGKTVFHCCEPDERLLEFAVKNSVYVGVDGDITYYPKKQEFIKKIPLENLVLETDSPFLIPDPLYTAGDKINEPQNLKIVLEFISGMLKIDEEKLEEITFDNSQRLFFEL